MVRTDFPIQHQAVQAVHAGIASARELIPADIQHPNLVLLTVPDRAALIAAADRCVAAGIPFRMFHEADMGNQATAFATAPVNGKARKVFKEFPLFGA